ncbi:hypothetical protein D9Q98_003792 [Chlorella vulgaris]|uniref:AP2/ERF domain-containing protein n=1 Tax=Chlorella vulgaris TaxID=3077 RepID=A0A9D4TQT2_CHLVU|nr:hypothetical protein D9Q98_003792 [Chlorella vulgaris]
MCQLLLSPGLLLGCPPSPAGKVSPETVIGMHLKSSNPGGLRMRGVTRHKRTQRYEGHIWESKKQVYLGAYDTEALAGMAHGKAPLLWHAFTTQPAAAGRAGDAGA